MRPDRRARARVFAAPIVVTSALLPACAQEHPPLPGNPPGPVTTTQAVHPNPPGPTPTTLAVASSAGPDTLASAHVNPPAPMPSASASASPDARLPDVPPETDPKRVLRRADGTCLLLRRAPDDLGPGMAVNPPPPVRVKCPPNAPNAGK